MSLSYLLFLSDLMRAEHVFRRREKYQENHRTNYKLFGMSKEECLTYKITFIDFGYLSFQLNKTLSNLTK